MYCSVAKCLFQLSLVWRHRHLYCICIFRIENSFSLRGKMSSRWKAMTCLAKKKQYFSSYILMRHMHIIYTVYVYVPILCIGVHVYAYWADANYAICFGLLISELHCTYVTLQCKVIPTKITVTVTTSALCASEHLKLLSRSHGIALCTSLLCAVLLTFTFVKKVSVSQITCKLYFKIS